MERISAQTLEQGTGRGKTFDKNGKDFVPANPRRPITIEKNGYIENTIDQDR